MGLSIVANAETPLHQYSEVRRRSESHEQALEVSTTELSATVKR